MSNKALSRRHFAQLCAVSMTLPVLGNKAFADTSKSAVSFAPKTLANGEQKLRDFAAQYQTRVHEIVPNKVYQAVGYGHSNAAFIIGDTSVILVDSLDSDVRGETLKKLIAERTDKPVKTIIYTHGHPDHRGGAGVFADSQPEVIAFAPVKPSLPRMSQLKDVFEQRGIKQMGYELSDEEALSQGYGIREGVALNRAKRAFLAPSTLYKNETNIARNIDGVKIELIAAPGEADDMIYVWLPDYQVVCCGDNYSGCWPNTSPLRGGQSRDLDTWIASLDKLIALNANALLLGHTRPVIGKAKIKEELTNFRNALDYVFTETLNCINQGMSMDETAETVRLPEKYAKLPYLGEYYGSVDWTVRGIYSLYIGWFDGNPTHIHPLPAKEKADKTIAMMGGQQAVLAAARDALNKQDPQWAAELADILLASDGNNQAAKQCKAQALLLLARQETSANSRHYYVAVAKGLMG
ncbi:alkyl/aryl-sulfatase [Testudinibacter aquarius]|uniref:Metallo-beta-lactamase superfamily protein n=2 Tax=Testudinibacter aquarius TaxID=1524974 RepID=A0A4R3YBC2_9PAST|nr:alkyl/aryl-sulfatase [Testudinibacter aquarius]TCV89266.1 metallo-beta-lactamase superfamily protein [Testudinibacter aquarius]